MTNQKISLPLNTLVCSDTFGLGHTISRVYPTSACKRGKVDVVFEEDIAGQDFNGREHTSTDEEGVTTTFRYRTVLVSFIDWDSEDEKEEVIAPSIINEDEKPEVSLTDEHGFDNVEAIEAALDAEEHDELAPVEKKTTAEWAAEAEKACAHLPEDDADFAERTGQEPSQDEDEDEAGYASFLANEFE